MNKESLYKLGCFARDGKGRCMNMAEAIYFLKKSAELGYHPAQNALAYLYAENDRNLSQALILAEKALKQQENASYLDTMGWVQYKLGHIHTAKAFLDKAIELSPNDPIIKKHMEMATQKHAVVSKNSSAGKSD